MLDAINIEFDDGNLDRIGYKPMEQKWQF